MRFGISSAVGNLFAGNGDESEAEAENGADDSQRSDGVGMLPPTGDGPPARYETGPEVVSKAEAEERERDAARGFHAEETDAPDATDADANENARTDGGAVELEGETPVDVILDGYAKGLPAERCVAIAEEHLSEQDAERVRSVVSEQEQASNSAGSPADAVVRAYRLGVDVETLMELASVHGPAVQREAARALGDVAGPVDGYPMVTPMMAQNAGKRRDDDRAMLSPALAQNDDGPGGISGLLGRQTPPTPEPSQTPQEGRVDTGGASTGNYPRGSEDGAAGRTTPLMGANYAGRDGGADGANYAGRGLPDPTPKAKRGQEYVMASPSLGANRDAEE